MVTWPILAGIGSLVVSVVGLWWIAWLLVRLPEDHFIRLPTRPEYRHPVLHAVLLIVCNLAGAVLVALGIAMLVLPGQGILTMLLGLSLLSIPGKHRLTHWILRRKAVRRGLNWIRRRAHQTPFRFPDGIAEHDD